MREPTPDKLGRYLDRLPPLPATVTRVIEVTASAEASAEDMAGVIGSDARVSEQLLRVVNSPFYGLSGRVTQLPRAVALLGTVAIRNLVIGCCVRDVLPHPPEPSEELDTLWRHSLAVASGAEWIAARIGWRPSEEAFVAGLLHDVGQIVMVSADPVAFRAVLATQGRFVRFLDLEREAFGRDHTQIGADVLERWGLPYSFRHVAAEHHQPQIVGEDLLGDLMAIVVLGDTFATMAGLGFDFPIEKSPRALAAAQLLKLTESDRVQLLHQLKLRTDLAQEMLTGQTQGRGSASESRRKALWVALAGGKMPDLSRLLLEQRGYEVRTISARQAVSSPREAILFISGYPANAAALAKDLHQRGYTNLIVVTEREEEGALLRWCDPESGMCYVPSRFTSHDLHWVTSKLPMMEPARA
jgi:putative nucleotidyltransferase with HDIG domain